MPFCSFKRIAEWHLLTTQSYSKIFALGAAFLEINNKPRKVITPFININSLPILYPLKILSENRL